ncbi:MAG: DUF423 domain-containing protein [Elusimicrobia bacterium]|nr:DUF423 domain-containing protein [Elusimicrobiota bacterium]
MTFWSRAAAIGMLLTVALGAFAAHGLKGLLTDEMKGIFETGVRYQAYHSLGLFVVAWAMSRSPSRGVQAAGVCFVAGMVLFSGSLYALSLTGARKLGMITPIGGVLFLAGWTLLALAP